MSAIDPTIKKCRQLIRQLRNVRQLIRQSRNVVKEKDAFLKLASSLSLSY